MNDWDFSHLGERYEEEQDLPWDYEVIVRAFLNPDSGLLDKETEGGAFLLPLGHPWQKTSATEGWPPMWNFVVSGSLRWASAPGRWKAKTPCRSPMRLLI